MKVLFASMEIAPFSKVGGLGDVASALPEGLQRAGVEVTLITPWYTSLPEVHEGFRRTRPLHAARLPFGNLSVPVVWKTLLHPVSSLRIVLVHEPRYLSQFRPYGGEFDDSIYSREPGASILFSKAIAEWVAHGDEHYDVVHLNEHQTAMAAPMIRQLPDPPPVVITVHNFYHQGVYGTEVLPYLGLPLDDYYLGGPLEFYGKVNFLKAGIWYSDALTTVSQTYRQEVMQDPAFALGLEGFLSSQADKFHGILNGIDVLAWDPRKDPNFMPHFSADHLEGKVKVKRRLLSEMQLAPRLPETTPVASVILRMVEQKGIDLILAVADRLMAKGAVLITMGEGRQDFMSAFQHLQQRHPAVCRTISHYNDNLAHRITAGADMFLMPSRFEPCGLTQMYSMAYGTVPIVRHTGGLADTVVDAREFPKLGTGFSFKNPHPEEFWDALSAGLNAYTKPKQWRAILRRGMRRQQSWAKPVQDYIDLYQSLTRENARRIA